MSRKVGILCCTLFLNFLFPMALGFQCYHCRQNICDNTYCDISNKLMESSGVAMSPEGWQQIQLCPDRANPEDNIYLETCQRKVDSCGRSIFQISTTSLTSIVPGNDSVVPVLGSGKEEVKSAVIVYGCAQPQYNTCHSGYSAEMNIPSNSSESSSTDLIITNTESACCRCDSNKCNGVEGGVQCSPAYHQVGNPNDVGTSGCGSHSPFTIITANIIFVLFILMVF